jgi:type IV pilus assembly protein PilA
MLARLRKTQEENEGGFTLIELLVVIIIIGILAAIAIPTFLNQRQKGYKADMKSTVKNAATAIESYATETGGSYIGLNNGDHETLRPEGFKKGTTQTVVIRTTADAYCVSVSDTRLSGVVYRYTSASGAPAEVSSACSSATG